MHGARQHNLKNIDVEHLRNSLIVITGLSGSGKSSLAFDTISAEGQRRYVETLSTYARSSLGQMEPPDVDSIDGFSPAISIEQKTTSFRKGSRLFVIVDCTVVGGMLGRPDLVIQFLEFVVVIPVVDGKSARLPKWPPAQHRR